MSDKSLAFVRFLSLRAALASTKTDIPTLHHDTDQLLGYIYELNAANHVVSMTHLFHKQTFGAPPTIQRRVKELIDAGLITTYEGVDKRQRYLKVTESGERYLQECSELLRSAVSGQACLCDVK